MSKDSGATTPAHMIEPYALRRARRAPARKIAIAREAAKLAATYARLRLPVPMRLTPLPLPEPEPEPTFIPYEIKRNRGATMGRAGRPPSAAREAAIAAGHKTYQGRPCRHGHSGLRFVNQNVCVGCARERREAAKKQRRDRIVVIGNWRSTEQPDTAKAGYRTCAVCGGAFDPWTRLRSTTCSARCARRARAARAVRAVRNMAGRRGRRGRRAGGSRGR